MEITGRVALQQFITENPKAEGLAGALKLQGMSDEQIVAVLKKSKSDWESGGAFNPLLKPPGDKAGADDVIRSFNGYSAEDLHVDIFAFMAMFQKIAQEMRSSARMDREASLQAEVSTLNAAAEKMKEAASERFKSAITQGICSIASGAIQMGSAGYSMKTMASAHSSTSLGAGKQGPAMSPEMSKGIIDKATAKSQNISQAGQGAGGIIGGVGTMISAGFDKKAGELDADAKKLEAQAKIYESATGKASDMMQQMQDIIRDIRDKLSAIQQSAIETNRGIARNI
jgi:hypothetical protein